VFLRTFGFTLGLASWVEVAAGAMWFGTLAGELGVIGWFR